MTLCVSTCVGRHNMSFDKCDFCQPSFSLFELHPYEENGRHRKGIYCDIKVEVSIFMYYFGQLNNMIVIGERRAVEGEDIDSVPHSLILVVKQHKTTPRINSPRHHSRLLVCMGLFAIYSAVVELDAGFGGSVV